MTTRKIFGFMFVPRFQAAVAACLVLAFTSVATAAVVVDVGDKLTYGGQTPGKFYSNGGEFTWTLTKNLNYPNNGLDPPNTFQPGLSSTLYTFCAEATEFITSPVYVTNITHENSTGVHQLTDKAAWLFYRYANGGNAAVATHATLTSDIARTIQSTIWSEMSYTPSFLPSGTGVTLYNSWFGSGGAYGNDLAWQNKANLFDAYVGVAWLSANYADVPDGHGGAQDQLVFLSSGGLSEVPEPASLAIWSVITCVGAALALRRRRQNPMG